MTIKILPIALLTLAGILATSGIASSARAENLMQGSARTQCLDMTSGYGRLATCGRTAGQSMFSGYGAQRYGTLCLQGTGGNNATNTLALKPCNGSRDQQWTLDSRTGNYKNEGGWCAAATSSGTVIAATCYGGGTYAWDTGTFEPGSAAGAAGVKIAIMAPGATENLAGQIVAKGGGSIVAQGGGNIVAQGGGNIVAQGGGNIIKTSGGAIVAQGGGN